MKIEKIIVVIFAISPRFPIRLELRLPLRLFPVQGCRKEWICPRMSSLSRCLLPLLSALCAPKTGKDLFRAWRLPL